MKYSKEEAIKIANDFINEVKKIQKKYSMTFNSDTGDIYLSFKSSEPNMFWDTISIGWDENGLKVVEEIKLKEKLREQALAKLTDDEREALGL